MNINSKLLKALDGTSLQNLLGNSTIQNLNLSQADIANFVSREFESSTPIGLPVVIRGTEGRDRLFGNNADNAFEALGGDDIIRGRGGNDLVYAGDGKDKIFGGGGDDKLYGEDGDDFIFGNGGNDMIYGGEGQDRAHGGSGNDTLYGGAGYDRLYGGSGDDLIMVQDGSSGPYDLAVIVTKPQQFAIGGRGDDTLVGNMSTNDRLYGGHGNDKLYAHDSNLRVKGNSIDRNDLHGGRGNDFLSDGSYSDGGIGLTVMLPDDASLNTHLYGGHGNDRFEINFGATAHGGAGADIFHFSNAIASETVMSTYTMNGRIDSFVASDDKIHLSGAEGGGTVSVDDAGNIVYKEPEISADDTSPTVQSQSDSYIIQTNNVVGEVTLDNFVFDDAFLS